MPPPRCRVESPDPEGFERRPLDMRNHSPLLNLHRHEPAFAGSSAEPPIGCFGDFAFADRDFRSDGGALRGKPIWPMPILV